MGVSSGQLGRFERTCQDTSGNASVGASVFLYREGATVNGSASGVSPLTVTVRHRGKIATGDSVFVNSTSGVTYTATVNSATSIVLSGFGGSISLSNGDRLVPSNSQPTLYSDDQAGATTSNPLTSNASGFAGCFMEYGAYEVLVSGGSPSLSAQLYQALVTPTEAIGQVRYADEFSTGSSTGGIQEAINDLPAAGGLIVLSNGVTYTPSVAITLISGLTIDGHGATIQRSNTNLNIFKDAGSAISKTTIRNIVFDNNSLAATVKDIDLFGGASDITVEGCRWINLLNRTADLTRIQTSASKGARITFRNNTVVGGTTTNTYNSFQIFDCDNVDVSGNVIDGWGAIKVEGSLSSTVNWSVRGNRMKNVDQTNIFCRVQGAASVRGVNISDNTLIDCGKSGIAYDAVNAGDTGTMQDATIANNTINGFGLTLEDDAIQVGGVVTTGVFYCTNVTVVGNSINGLKSDGTFSGTPARGLSIEAGTKLVSVFANTIRNCGRSGIGIGASDSVVMGNTVERCVRTDTSGSPPTPAQESGIATFGNTVYQCNNVLVAGNICKNNGVSGAVKSYGIALVANNTGTNSNHYAFFNRCYDDQGTKTQDYGITIGAAGGTGPSSSKIAFNDLSGNQTGHALIQGTNTGLTYMPPPAKGTNIASAATISIPQDGDTFHVTGAVNITNGITVNTGDAGRFVTLVFDSTPTVTDTGTSVMAGNFVATADDTLTLRCDGTSWYEVARSIN